MKHHTHSLHAPVRVRTTISQPSLYGVYSPVIYGKGEDLHQQKENCTDREREAKAV